MGKDGNRKSGRIQRRRGLLDCQGQSLPALGNVRTLTEEDGTILFCGKDVAEALGYARPNEAITDHCRGVTLKRRTTDAIGRMQETTFITEPDLYRLIVASKLPSAEKFGREFVCLGIFISNDRPVVSSRDIARVFEKEHYNVLKAIKALDCSKSFTDVNFELSEYEDSTGRSLPEYLITRDGFSFLTMGFTGAKALQWKTKYI